MPSFALELEARVNIVVVGQGNDRGQVEMLDLLLLQVVGRTRVQGPAPVGAGEIHRLSGLGAVPLHLAAQEERNDRHALGGGAASH